MSSQRIVNRFEKKITKVSIKICPRKIEKLRTTVERLHRKAHPELNEFDFSLDYLIGVTINYYEK